MMARLLEPSFTQGPSNGACMLCLLYMRCVPGGIIKYFKTCTDHTVPASPSFANKGRETDVGRERRPAGKGRSPKIMRCSLLCCYAGKGLEHGHVTGNGQRAGAGRRRPSHAMYRAHVMQGVPSHACCAPSPAAKRSRGKAGPRHSPLTSTTAMARGPVRRVHVGEDKGVSPRRRRGRRRRCLGQKQHRV
jgi:hypothetical protein